MGKNSKRDKENDKAVWDVLLGVAASVGQTTNITAVLIPFLQNKELIAKIIDQARFNRLAGTLNNDMRMLSGQFKTIYDQHSDRRGSAKNPDEWMSAISLHEQYVSWASTFDDVAIPTFLDMMSMLQEAGADTSQVQTPSASNTVEQFNHS